MKEFHAIESVLVVVPSIVVREVQHHLREMSEMSINDHENAISASVTCFLI